MTTAIKNTRTKTKKIVSKVAVAPEEIEAEIDILPVKNKKPIEIDELEPAVILDDKEEKLEEDPLVAATETEEETEEIGIDAEELNPFGDRWEE